MLGGICGTGCIILVQVLPGSDWCGPHPFPVIPLHQFNTAGGSCTICPSDWSIQCKTSLLLAHLCHHLHLSHCRACRSGKCSSGTSGYPGTGAQNPVWCNHLKTNTNSWMGFEACTEPFAALATLFPKPTPAGLMLTQVWSHCCANLTRDTFVAAAVPVLSCWGSLGSLSR